MEFDKAQDETVQPEPPSCDPESSRPDSRIHGGVRNGSEWGVGCAQNSKQ